MYLNTHTLSGNIGRDATLREAGSSKVLSFSLANTSPYGEKVTTWYNVSLWGKQAETLADKLVKGTQVVVVGETSMREYKNKDGEVKTSLDFRASNVQLAGRAGNGAGAGSASVEEEEDEDIPF